MHLRYSTSRRNGKTYRYAQLVESYRNESGRPAVRVIAHLGAISDSLFEALRTALDAVRKGEGLVLESEVAGKVSGSILANLRYLDLAVLMECWEQWELSNLIDELAPGLDTDLSLTQVLLPLVLQRCVDPGSKLRATRWIKRTALPELLGFDLQAFNNSRIHRTLDVLYDIGEDLQHKLTQRYMDADGPFEACFMDLTDTYFEGAGPEIAELTRTKSKIPNKRCIGIVLLANERGYPLRWKLVAGKTRDWTAMSGLLREMGDVSWLKETLIVFDRAMGNQSTVTELKKSGLHFLTASHRNAISTWAGGRLCTKPFGEVDIGGTDESYEEDIKAVAKAARDAGWTEIHEHLFVDDLGLVAPTDADDNKSDESKPAVPKRGLLEQLERAGQVRAYIEAHDATHEQAGAAFGRSRTQIGHYLSVLRLAPKVQQRVRECGVELPCSESLLRHLLTLSPHAQLARLEEIIAGEEEDVTPLRMVAYFNPRLFVDMRNRAQRHLRELDEAFESINAELAVAKRSRKERPTFRKFSKEIERRAYLDTFDIELEPRIVKSKAGREIRSFHGILHRNEKAWARKRTYDGIVLLLGHPDLAHTGVELVQSYHAKDVVEKDFQTIKSVVELRPLFHYRDPKVEAHVSICMLALLLLRTLGDRLSEAVPNTTAERCLEELASCHLNLRCTSMTDQICYDLTRLDDRQNELVDALRMARVSDLELLRTRVQPRAGP